MANFQEFFENTNESTIQYKGKTLHWSDKFPVSNGDKLVITIEETNSDCPQGYSIDITGYCIYQGETYKKGKGIKMIFWEDTAPKKVELTIFTKKDHVWIQNIWELKSNLGNRMVDSGHYGAAMIAEEIENGRRYRCNDYHPDENFNDIVFTVQRIK